MSYPRDMVGYGRNLPDPQWPGDAAIAVQFVLNYEEGAENSVLDGDPASETFLSEMTPAEAFRDRHMSMETLYEYGSRAGLWRLLRLFEGAAYRSPSSPSPWPCSETPRQWPHSASSATRSLAMACGGSPIS